MNRTAPASAATERRPSGLRNGLIALAGLVAYAVVGVACFVVPHSDRLPGHADVAMVLGSLTPEREATAMDLLQRGAVGGVQFSVWPSYGEPGSPTARALALCRIDSRVHCAVPDPATTQGEARMLRDAANEHGWRSAVVITQNAHLLRARTIVGRCFTGTITMHASGEGPEHGWPFQVLYQTAATVKSWLVTPGC